jgi:dihydroxyacetone kinase-like protein
VSDLEATTVTTAVSVTAWMREASAAVTAEADHLTQLDSAIGDGDHGVNLTRGFKAAVEAVDGSEEPPGRQLIVAGKTLVSKVGGASGPLWGTALRRAGRAVGSAQMLEGAQLVDALSAGLAGVVELGAAVPMQARKGRASYLGERSVGHQDPGATSTALIVRALGRALVPAG